MFNGIKKPPRPTNLSQEDVVAATPPSTIHIVDNQGTISGKHEWCGKKHVPAAEHLLGSV
jgi:hypothetical protein